MSGLRLPLLLEDEFLVVLVLPCGYLLLGVEILLVVVCRLELCRSQILLLESLSIRSFSITGVRLLLL